MRYKKNQLKLLDAPVFSYWSALLLSFYSRMLYIDVGKRWKGLGILYLLLALAVFLIPFTVRMSYSLDQSFREQITEPLLKIPSFYIQKGEAIFDKPMPYLIKNSKGEVLVLIDTTGQVNDFTKQYPNLTILINKEKIAFKIPSLSFFNMSMPKSNKSSPIVQHFDKSTNMVFNGRQLAEESMVNTLKYAAELITYPVLIASFFSMFLIFFLIFGFLGQLFSRIFFSFSISFVQSIRLLMVAGTPMLVFLIALLTTNSVFPGSGFVLFFLLIAYYSFALFALRADSRHLAKL